MSSDEISEDKAMESEHENVSPTIAEESKEDQAMAEPIAA